MNYQKTYTNIVNRGIPRGLNKKELKGYYEKHHVIPKCLGGTNDKTNLVLLTGREHFIAHRLLTKIYKDNKSLFFALYQMSIDKTKNRNLIVSSRTYDSLRKQFSVNQSGKNNPACRYEVRNKISASNRGKISSFKGKKHTEKAKKMMSDSASIRCKGEGNSRYGAVLTDETKKKISDSLTGRTSKLKGIPRTNEDCVKIAKGIRDFYQTDLGCLERNKHRDRMKGYNIRPWQTPKVKNNISILTLWAKADVLYMLWMKNNKPKELIFSKLYNNITEDYEKPNRFKNILKKFISGWVPVDDSEWVTFSQGITFEPNPFKDLS